MSQAVFLFFDHWLAFGSFWWDSERTERSRRLLGPSCCLRSATSACSETIASWLLMSTSNGRLSLKTLKTSQNQKRNQIGQSTIGQTIGQRELAEPARKGSIDPLLASGARAIKTISILAERYFTLPPQYLRATPTHLFCGSGTGGARNIHRIQSVRLKQPARQVPVRAPALADRFAD